jgi:hypothetical protein
LVLDHEQFLVAIESSGSAVDGGGCQPLVEPNHLFIAWLQD